MNEIINNIIEKTTGIETLYLIINYESSQKIKQLEEENNELKKEIEFYKESLQLHPDGAEILELKKDFLEKVRDLPCQNQ